ncbi:hypothetical protein GOP47_0021149 [Adiantum capillus-veneris]|uniref:Uncharacterized protein n=1 Tax=Adiantum capillus-veneris TaxID=13818 RepID=A0A9D4Z7M4_ADICA|nr:hypothetical protein GOP47_0021149 [Adiantum capillus-veneris]
MSTSMPSSSSRYMSNISALRTASASRSSACLPLCFPIITSSSTSADRLITNAAESADHLSFNGDLHSKLHTPSADHDPCSSSLLSFSEADDHHLIKLMARSYSCSKMEYCGFNALSGPLIKSLLHRNRSHGRLHGAQPCSSRLMQCEHASDREGVDQGGSSRSAALSSACLSEYTRSWSSPSLGRMKKASSSFHGELRSKGGARSSIRKGKRAPKGHVAVYVDGGNERHVVPISYLSHPQFQELLQRAEREFGFAQKGALTLPCSQAELQYTLHLIRHPQPLSSH